MSPSKRRLIIQLLSNLIGSNNYSIFVQIDLWHESQNQRKNRRKGASSGGLFSPDRRRKPVSVTGPYIVYMLKDVDIIEDWTAIKKVCCFCLPKSTVYALNT